MVIGHNYSLITYLLINYLYQLITRAGTTSPNATPRRHQNIFTKATIITFKYISISGGKHVHLPNRLNWKKENARRKIFATRKKLNGKNLTQTPSLRCAHASLQIPSMGGGESSTMLREAALHGRFDSQHPYRLRLRKRVSLCNVIVPSRPASLTFYRTSLVCSMQLCSRMGAT